MMKHLYRNLSAPATLALTLCAGLSMLAPSTAEAVPARKGTINYTQPDGTRIPIIVRGDETFTRAFTLDGREVVRDEEGYLIEAEKTPLMTRAGGENPRYLFEGTSFPSKGSPKVLVILVDFPDQAFSMDDPKAFYTEQLNKPGYSLYEATGSALDYFRDNSGGVFTPQFDVYGPVTTVNKVGYYGRNSGLSDADANPHMAVIEGCQGIDDEVDFFEYDNDGDGYIDNVYVIYAGYGEADSYISKTIWPHSANIMDLNLGRTYRFDQSILNRYAMSNELSYTYERPDGIGTFVHEFSHVLGLPDLYSTTYDELCFTPGWYSILDAGPYLNEGRTPPYYSAFERYCLDWLQPEEFPHSGEYDLAPLGESNKGYLIPTDNEDEFFIVENRQPKGWDEYLPGCGLLVWHIDFVQDIWDRNEVNNTATHQYVDIVEADDDQDYYTFSGDTFPGKGNVTSLSFDTTPSLCSWDGKSTGISLSEIRENDDDWHAVFTVKYDVEPLSVASIMATGDVYVAGGQVVNGSDTDLPVYDLAGRQAAMIPAGNAVTLPAGIYICGAKKLVVR